MSLPDQSLDIRYAPPGPHRSENLKRWGDSRERTSDSGRELQTDKRASSEVVLWVCFLLLGLSGRKPSSKNTFFLSCGHLPHFQDWECLRQAKHPNLPPIVVPEGTDKLPQIGGLKQQKLIRSVSGDSMSKIKASCSL